MQKLVEYNESLNKPSIFHKIQKQVAIILGIVLVIALGANLSLLTFLGTKGDELSKIRNAQEQQKLINDLYRSRIEALNVNTEIDKQARDELKMRKSDIIIIDSDNLKRIAAK